MMNFALRISVLCLLFVLGGCLQGGPGAIGDNAASGASSGPSGGSSGDVADASSPALPSGIVPPAAEGVGDEKLALRTAAVTFSKRRTITAGLDGSFTGRVSCRTDAEHPLEPCLSGRVLRIFNLTKGFYVDTLLKTDDGGEGFFETPRLYFPLYNVLQDLSNPYDAGNDWMWMVSPEDHEPTVLDTIVLEVPDVTRSASTQPQEAGTWGMLSSEFTAVEEEPEGIDVNQGQAPNQIPPLTITKPVLKKNPTFAPISNP